MKKIIVASLLATVLTAGTTLSARAELDSVPPVKDPVVIKECGACHMVFQPAFLPAASWTKLMSDLKNHFGDNATLDPAIAKTITDYLTANAAAGGRKGAPVAAGAEPPLRISELAWFKAKHDKRGRSSPENLKKHNAKSMSDCKACHIGADKGYYEDD